MSGVSAGLLAQRIRLEQQSTAQDSFGGQSETWSEVITVWAGVFAMTGRERLAAQAIHPELTHQIIVRWHPLLADPKTVAGMRVVLGSRHFDIHAALDEDGRKTVLTLLATEN